MGTDEQADPGEAGNIEPLNSIESSLPIETSLPQCLKRLKGFASGNCNGLSEVAVLQDG